MIPWVHLATAAVPGNGGELKLMQRGHEFSIMSGSTELMNSRLSGSEEALATLSAERLAATRAPAVLIGGYGMGFTLRAALKAFGPEARITVGELVPEVLDWAKGPMATLSGDSLVDPRLTLAVGDVASLIRGGSWDAILLDVDNGPEGLSRRANDRLYNRPGLATAREALRPGGLFCVWSSAPHDPFTRRLEESGFEVEEVRVRATGTRRGARHVIWIARRPRDD